MPQSPIVRSSFPAAASKRSQWHAVSAGFLGWTLDAFDFFVVILLVGTLAQHFHVAKSAIIWSLTLTLAFRPVGAILFGLLADRYGRRIPLMANVVFFSVIELACGFAPNFTVFLVLRALYGIGMGGEWGVGASLVMETVSKRWRGLLSGILQSGYSIGYLLAAVAARFILPSLGWRWMFWIGGLPALLAFYINSKVPESEAWHQNKENSTGAILRTVGQYWKESLYLVLMMTLMMFLSHGTQDLYPDFLASVHHLIPAHVAYVVILYNIGAIAGAILFGHLSEHLGRRRSMIAALTLSLVCIPLWAFGSSAIQLALGAFLMQVGVQGAWGIVPVHLTELAPDAARSLLPGLAYQLGILIAAPTSNIEYMLRDHIGYPKAMASFEVFTIVVGALVIALGWERRGKDFVKTPMAVE